MTKKKVSTAKKTTTTKPKAIKTSKKSPKSVVQKPKDIVEQVTTVEETRGAGYWTRVTTVKYIKQLLCPAFFKSELILTFAALPLLILIVVILWRLTTHE